jgi:hypothetical protein
MKDRQNNGRSNNGRQNTTEKTKNLATGTPLKNLGWTLVLWKGKQFLFHMWHTSCYSFYEAGDRPWTQKGPDCDYDKRNITVVICDTDIP